MRPDGSEVIHVTDNEVGKSLVQLLKARYADQAWSHIRKLLSSRRVQVNGNLCLDEGRRLTPGEVVKILPHSVAPPPREDDIKIRYMDAHVVVVEKPAGMTTLRHSEELNWPAHRKQIQPTLDEILPRIIAKKIRGGSSDSKQTKRRPSNLKHQKDRPEKERIPGVRAVHRLDRDTSGLMVFARSMLAERHLVQQFRKHTVLRSYMAVAHGDVHAQTIRTNLVRDRGDGRRGSTTLGDTGQHSVTHVKPLEKLKGFTVIECRLETGRTHQIRIHLSENGHFICGDKVYCQPLFKKQLIDTSGAPRLALHAKELGFVHPVTGETIHFSMPPPRDIAEFLDRLRSDAKRKP